MLMLQVCYHSGALNRYGPSGLMCLNVWSTGSGIIRRCGLFGIGVALLKEMYFCGCRL